MGDSNFPPGCTKVPGEEDEDFKRKLYEDEFNEKSNEERIDEIEGYINAEGQDSKLVDFIFAKLRELKFDEPQVYFTLTNEIINKFEPEYILWRMG